LSAAHPSAPASSEPRAPERVRRMFAAVAPRYDLINHLLSFNIDRSWRTALRQALQPVLQSHGSTVLDLCCGTGDVLLDLQAGSHSTVLGADFCHPMLLGAHMKAVASRIAPRLLEADALCLPFQEDSLHAISIAFGYRNLADYDAGLREMHRVLRPGGMLAILEFSHPRTAVLRGAYSFYSRFILPAVGGLISGAPEAYRYLPDSITRFPTAERLREMMTATGFQKVQVQLLTGGIAALHVGTKS
jgi:demethylmenaquinone methyltransferase / 2-methoxy-6-polyprenyl-1,4-benzoquinol methylase